MVAPLSLAAPAGSVYVPSMLAGTTSPPAGPVVTAGSPSNSSTTTPAGGVGIVAGRRNWSPGSASSFGAYGFTSPSPWSNRAALTFPAAGTTSGVSTLGQSNTIRYSVLPLRVTLPHFGGAAIAN